jgi:Holliday junction resolvasome RuvABC DNA-binding subunit
MFHIFFGKLEQKGKHKFLINDVFGIQVAYAGNTQEGTFFLFPYRDDNRKTISYYAFDTIEQRDMFETVLKISGI